MMAPLLSLQHTCVRPIQNVDLALTWIHQRGIAVKILPKFCFRIAAVVHERSHGGVPRFFQDWDGHDV